MPGVRHYQFHGINLVSTTDLADIPFSTAPDDPSSVTIRVGDVPTSLPNATATNITYQVAQDQCLLTLPRIARYLVSGGREIVYHNAGDEQSAMLFLLYWAFPALLHQLGILPLYASAIETPQGAVVFCGAPGAGKSTIAAKLVQQGYHLLADDLVAVRLDDAGQPQVMSGSPTLHLWLRSLRQLGYTDKDISALQALRPGLFKYRLPVDAHSGFCDHPLPLARLYLVYPVDHQPPTTPPVSQRNALPTLLHHITHRQMAFEMGKMRQHWQTAAQIMSRVEVSFLTYRGYGFESDQLAPVVEQDLQAL